MKKNKSIKDKILLLSDLEVEVKRRYEDKDIFEEINSRKKSLAFFIKNKIHDRAIYELDYLIENLTNLVTEI